MTISRRQAREWAIQMLTAADLNPASDPTVLVRDFWEQLSSLDEDEGGLNGHAIPEKYRAFAEARVLGVLNRLEALDAKLTPLLTDWDLSRLGTVERAVLRLGAWELLYAHDVPPRVVINEALDLANWFSTPRSRTIVNAVLDRLSKERGHGDAG